MYIFQLEKKVNKIVPTLVHKFLNNMTTHYFTSMNYVTVSYSLA